MPPTIATTRPSGRIATSAACVTLSPLYPANVSLSAFSASFCIAGSSVVATATSPYCAVSMPLRACGSTQSAKYDPVGIASRPGV